MMKGKQRVQKIAALSLAGLLGCSTFSACGPQGGNDGTKSQLNIKVFNGGFGDEWVNELKANFERTFKDVSFEEGKKGVYVAITPDKASFTNLNTQMSLGIDKDDIYYTSTCDFVSFTDYGVAYDVTDIMTANVYDEEGNVALNANGDGWKTQPEYKSIADRISIEHTRERLNVGTEENPQYFALPFEDTTVGIVVDWDLFQDEGWDNYNGIDGMPATMTEFYDLLNRIRKKGYSAFIMSTGVQYTRVMQAAVIAQVDGSDTYYDLFSDYKSNEGSDWNGDGIISDDEKGYDFNEDGIISDDEIITPNTAYKLIDTRGYRAAVEMGLKLFEKNANGKTFYDPAVANGVSYGAAQQDFIMSKETAQPIAMLFEGEWWENEARATFNAMGAKNEENGYGKREFRMMPIPSFDSTNEEQKYTLGAWTGGCITLVNEKTVGEDPVKQKLVELWLQYQNSTEGLKCFTKHTAVTLPLDYELTEEDLQEITPFGRNLYKLKRDYNVEIIHNDISIQEENVYRGSAKLAFAARFPSNKGYSGPLFNNLVSLRNTKLTANDYIAAMHTWYDELIKTGIYPEN